MAGARPGCSPAPAGSQAEFGAFTLLLGRRRALAFVLGWRRGNRPAIIDGPAPRDAGLPDMAEWRQPAAACARKEAAR